MGTRSLIIIYYQGQYVVAQYSQWDGYPEGQGSTILKFFNEDSNNLQKLKDKLHVIQEVTEAEADRIFQEMDQLQQEQFRSSGVYDPKGPLPRLYPGLSRDTGAALLKVIANAKEDDKIPVQLALEFAADYLFCEWMYVIDLDTEKLEVYSGGENKEGARSQRFPQLWSTHGKHANEKLANQPIVPQMLADFALAKLPKQAEFVAFFDELNDQEDGDLE